MILELIQETGKQLQTYKRVEQDKSFRQKVKTTQDKLETLRQRAAVLLTHIRATGDILEPHERQHFADNSERLLGQLRHSLKDFEQQPLQSGQIKPIIGSIEELQRQLRAAWQRYAQEQIAPRKELYRLISSLPDVAQQRSQIDTLFRQLEATAGSFPNDQADRTKFEDRLTQLDRHLEAHRGLSDTIRHFLEKVRKHECTVADLNDEILTWCREGGRGRAFKITL